MLLLIRGEAKVQSDMSLVVNLPKKFKLAYYVLLVILSLIGVIAIVVRLIAGLSAVIGIVAVRLNLVIPALVVPVLKGLDTAFIQPRWSFCYFPSLWEWASTIGLIALVVLGFSVAFQILPIFGEVERK